MSTTLPPSHLNRRRKAMLARIVRRAGGPSRIAEVIGTTPMAISMWREKGLVPIDRVPAVEQLSGIPRHLIRPDRPDLFPPPKDEAMAS